MLKKINTYRRLEIIKNKLDEASKDSIEDIMLDWFRALHYALKVDDTIDLPTFLEFKDNKALRDKIMADLGDFDPFEDLNIE
ncbi:TPA: hypothetical protein ACQN7J_001444 [Streptococcus pyogenes]|uniref:Uncharacterized protein n=2 Tax=Streptococcus TaxID=1301 RepID=A0A660A3C4_STRPY|nr:MULTISPECIES: hypothetical protein [Streptococcus]EQL80249.1 hypothetical protein HMPREF1225_0448 [Streptococcus pyogenes UTSW-2]ESA56233.1 hypothetical protein HMPREF1238_1388 [Streptococcus pyogenes GA40377]QBX10770.1 hypothetical protein JavanS479_0005 [Streptococcus satellite phage Javan479]QBX10976.1 hypothetical protein JavanS519_0005 [Streptococcus satellite phage Javan519]HEP6188240.1 hypothetical protein [Streptococcus pyogenes ABC020038034]HEP6203871.1 hypothetical protein [Strep